MIHQLIERYEAGADEPRRAIRDLSPAHLDAFPVPGTWSIRQIVVHLMDSDLIASYRMKLVASMNEPRITAYDESALVRSLDYTRTDASLACELFRLNRLMTAATLRLLPLESFDRAGIHEEAGRLTLRGLLQTYTDHVDHHLGFIRQKRALLRVPLAADAAQPDR